MKRFLTVLALLLVLPAGALTAAPQWTPLGPFGGFVSTLTVDPVDVRVLYATSGEEGTFKSTDGGATWFLIHTGFAVGNVAVDPARHSTLYQAINYQVLKSTDGGATWSASNRGLPPNPSLSVMAADPARRNRLYLAASGVWRSLDGGFSWRAARRPLPDGDAQRVLALAAAPSPAGTVYAATGAGVFKSVDAGDSWKSASRGLPPGAVASLVLAPANPKLLWACVGAGVFRSTNGGASWSPAASQPAGADRVRSLAIGSSNPAPVWVGTFTKGIYRTNDAGAHWTPAGPRPDAAISTLATGGATLYAGVFPAFGDPGGVLASGDGGATWQARNTGFTALDADDLAIDPHHPEILWVAASNLGLYHSTVGGRVWDSHLQPPAVVSGSGLTAGLVAFSADGAVVYTTFNNEIWASGDAGTSWRRALESVYYLLAHPLDAATVYAYQQAGGLVASHDSGATWQALDPGAWCFFETLAVAPSAPATLYAAGFNRTGSGGLGCGDSRAAVSRSTDGGATWTAAASPAEGGGFLSSLVVDPFDPQTVYAQTVGSPNPAGVWKSTDGGAIWFRAGGRTLGSLAVSAGGGTLWGAAGNQFANLDFIRPQVFASHDGAAIWQPVGGPQAFLINRLIPDPLDPNRLYAATSGGVWVLEP